MIPAEKWRWFGNPAHLICADSCLFHLVTEIGSIVVSTVGDWRPDRKGGDLGKMHDIGCGRKYETMVFRVAGRCSCGCGLPTHNGENVDFDAYLLPGEAAEGHRAMCVKYAELDGRAE